MRIEIDGDHAAARRLGQLNRQHANQPGADHGHDFAQDRLALTESLERDGANGGQRRGLQRHRIRNSGGKIFGDEIDFTVAGVSGAGTCHSIAGLKLLHSLARSQHNPRAAIAQRTKRIQSRLHSLVSRFHARRSGKIEYLADQVGTSQGFAQQGLFHLLAMGQLGACADGRKRSPHQDAAGTQLRLRHFVAGHFPGANVFQNGSHGDWLLSHQGKHGRKMETARNCVGTAALGCPAEQRSAPRFGSKVGSEGRTSRASLDRTAEDSCPYVARGETQSLLKISAMRSPAWPSHSGGTVPCFCLPSRILPSSARSVVPS